MAANPKKPAAVAAESEEPEEYTQNLIYTINIYVQDGGTFNIIAENGGHIKFNSGKPAPFPPPHG